MHGPAPTAPASDDSYRLRSTFHVPPAEFDGCFTSFYHLDLAVEDGFVVSDHMQPEWGSMRFFAGNRPHASIGDTRLDDVCFGASGPTSRPTYFSLGTARVWGIGFLPLGWARAVDCDACDLADTIVDGQDHPAFAKYRALTEVLCDADADADPEAQLAAIGEVLRAQMRPHREEDKILRVHTALIDPGSTSVGTFAARSDMSVRSLERICLKHFGFPPKLMLRRQRLMRSLTAFMMHPQHKWTDVLDEGYHDQSQFSREFRAFMGVSPREYVDQPHPFLDSFIEARARSLGSPALTLDPPA